MVYLFAKPGIELPFPYRIPPHNIVFNRVTALSSIRSFVSNSPRKAQAKMDFLMISICVRTDSAEVLAWFSILNKLQITDTILTCSAKDGNFT